MIAGSLSMAPPRSRRGATVRGTVALAAVLGALEGWFWWAQLQPRAVPEPVEEPPLLAAPGTSVSRIEFEENGRTLVAVRSPSGWVDAAGRAWRGDVVSDLVDALSSQRPAMVVDPAPEDPTDYGLGPDAPRLRLLGAGGAVLLAIEVGERNDAWTGVYARLAGRPAVVLVDTVLHWELEQLRDAQPEE